MWCWILLHCLCYYSFFIMGSVDCVTKDVRYIVLEESGKDTFVGSLKEDSGIAAVVPGPINFIMDQDADKDNLFRLEMDTGKLFVAKNIDREALCIGPSSNKDCALQLTVYVPQDNWINVEIHIMDVNDHQPLFTDKSKLIRISEAVKTSYKIPLTIATDDDAYPNNVKKYSLNGAEGLFDVNYSPPYNLHLVVLSSLDHETQKVYNATLLACDGGKPPLCGSQLLTIVVTDVNDNKPKFEKQTYYIEINETIPIGAVITRVRATDEDAGRFGQVTYRFGQQVHDMNVINHFNIRDTGEIYLRKILNARKTPLFTIMLEAVDGGDIPFVGQATLEVKVLDTNNNRPKIQIKPLLGGSAAEVTVPENMKNGTYIALVWSTDGDVGKNGKVECRITSGINNFRLEHSNSAKGREIYSLMTNKSFNRETESKIPVQIRCFDHGVPSLSHEEDLDVYITDQNEFAPEFEPKNYSATIDENQPIGVPLVRVYAKDQDATAQLQYKLPAEAVQYFQIDANTGLITTNSRLDRENTDVIRFSVLAIDKATPRILTAIASITVIVNDVNDDIPTLVDRRDFQVMENQPSYYGVVGKLTATDRDNGLNGTVNYKLLRVLGNGTPVPNSTFKIDARSGDIFVRDSLDRELFSKYQLVVLVYDLGTPANSATETVTISVLDENDNHPKWIYPNEHDHELNLTGPIPPGEKLTNVRAIDQDSIKNANLTYHILEKRGFFNLGSMSGELHAADMLSEGRYLIKLRVIDNGQHPRKTDIDFKINVVPGGPSLADRQGRARLNFTLIIGMVSATALICIVLLIAIVVVRRRSGRHRREESLRKWAEDNVYPDSWGRPGHFGPPPPMHGFPGPDLTPKEMPNFCNSNTLHIRAMPVDMEVASADSGHGASEEDQYNLDSKVARDYRPTAHLLPGMRGCPILPEDSIVQCGCQDYLPLTSVHQCLPPNCPPPHTTSSNGQHGTPPMRTFPRPTRPPTNGVNIGVGILQQQQVPLMGGDSSGSIDRLHMKTGSNGTLQRPNTPRQTNL